MPENSLDLENIPLIDNHCHAGLFEMVIGLDEGLSLRAMREISLHCALQSAFSPHEYKTIKKALTDQDEEKLNTLDSRFGIKKILSDIGLFTSRTNLYEVLQEQAYQSIYGPTERSGELEKRVQGERRSGLVDTYINSLDRSGISLALNNTFTFDPNQWPIKRFRWISHLDTFVFPLWGERFLMRGGATEDYGDYVFRHPGCEMAQHLSKSGLKEIPRNFLDYLTWVHETLNRLKNEGVVALKLLMAYFRTLETEEVSSREAEAAFKNAIRGNLEDVKKFEDFMVRDLILHCGMLDLPVQIHVGEGGPGPGLHLGHSRPMLLQRIFEHPELRKTKIVLLHAGRPYSEECASLVGLYWNTYLDISSLTITSYSWLVHQLSYWIETIPSSRILFGTDAWTPELFWVGAVNGRRAIQECLERMISLGFFSATEAMEVASGILYKNASRLYNLSIQ